MDDDSWPLFELHPQPMWVTDRDTRFLAVNRATRELYGWTNEEFAAMSLRDIRPPEDVPNFEAVYAIEQRNEGTYQRASRHRTKDGRVLDVSLSMTRLQFRGRPATLAVITNTTGVADVERRFQLMVEHSSEGISLVAEGGIITYISPGGAQILGLTPSQVIGRNAIELMNLDDYKNVPRAKPGETIYVTQRGLHADGTWRWIESVSTNLTHDPAVRAHVSNFRDVTKRHEAETLLRRSEANFRALIERSPNATFVHRDGKYVYANDAAATMIGYPANELVGRAVIDDIHPDDRDQIRARIALTSVGRPIQSPVEARLVRRDGTTIAAEARAVLLDFDGQPASVVIVHDVTQRRELFARMALADRMLTVGTLAAGVAHEINNPLAYLIANLGVIESELPALAAGQPTRLDHRELASVLTDAKEGAARVSAIVRDLRAMSRPEDAGGPVDVAAALVLSIKMASNELRHRARMVQDIAVLPPVLASSSRLSQVFLNLLVNAAHAIDVGRIDDNEVRVRAHADAEHVYVAIEDTGVGISPDVLDHIFDPFFTTKPAGMGMGLGLSICHQIIEQLGGRIDVTSSVGKGSTFRVSLPIAPRVEVAQTGDQLADPRAARARILMIDDEAAVGRSLRLLLAPDHDVIAVTRAAEALARLTGGERFDMIICDLMMPEMSGIEFYRQLVARAPAYTRRVVFMTGGAFTSDARDFLTTVGAVSLAKPFTEQELRAVIASTTGATHQ